MPDKTSALRPKVRQAFRQMGYEVHRVSQDRSARSPAPIATKPAVSPENDPEQVLKLALSNVAPAEVIDVGANIGQYAELIREFGVEGPMISFEPLPGEHEQTERFASSDPLWQVAPRMALGSETGSAEINVSQNSYSSSLLPILEEHVSGAPESAYVDKIPVDVRRLDDVLEELSFNVTKGWLKVDTQGFEHQVLFGAPATLAKCVAVQTEISLVPLYAGQVPAWETIALLGEAGFDLAYTMPVFASEGRMLQIDAIFVRRP